MNASLSGCDNYIAAQAQRNCYIVAMVKTRVLFVCTGNRARSQMAEGLLRHLAGDRFDVFSAGTMPSGMSDVTIAAMHEIGIDLSGQWSKSVAEYAGQAF